MKPKLRAHDSARFTALGQAATYLRGTRGGGGGNFVPYTKSSLARGHRGGGGDWGYPELGPGTPPWVRGSIYKKKTLQDPGPILKQRPQYAKKF